MNNSIPCQETVQLDSFDLQLITHFKRDEWTIDSVKQIWAKRCAIDVEYVHLENINHRLLELVNQLQLLKNDYTFIEFVNSLDPAKNWRYAPPNESVKDFHSILFTRLACLLTNTETRKIPGLYTYIHECNGPQKLNASKYILTH